jgi:hypothetical protein
MADDFSQSIDRLKESFLWAAAQGGNVQDCSSLIEFGADINWKGPGGDTPLLTACRRGHLDTVSLLLAHGASVNAAGDDSMSPIHIASRRGDHALLNVLLDSNVDTSIRTAEGVSAVEMARSKGYEDICAMLTNRGVSVPRVHRVQRNDINDGLTSAHPPSSRILPALVSPRTILDSAESDVTVPKLGKINGSALLHPTFGQDKSKRDDRFFDSSKAEEARSTVGFKGKYTLIGNSAINTQMNDPRDQKSVSVFDETTTALQNMLGQEQREKKLLENKVSMQ